MKKESATKDWEVIVFKKKEKQTKDTCLNVKPRTGNAVDKNGTR